MTACGEGRAKRERYAPEVHSVPDSAECHTPQIRLTPMPASCLLRTSGLASLAAPRTVSTCAKYCSRNVLLMRWRRLAFSRVATRPALASYAGRAAVAY